MAFAFGWFLYKNVDLLGGMQRWARTQVAATGGVLVLLFFIGNWMGHHRAGARFIIAGAVSVVMWLLICGLTGVFLRYCDRPMPRMRYVADSSYWLYIVHMLALMAFQMLLRSVAWPAALKVWVVLLLAIPLMLLSYHYLVRPTFIGQVLNGRRY
jgi:peptidoglycan/LPS O-acetylase OafA/YrhL